MSRRLLAIVWVLALVGAACAANSETSPTVAPDADYSDEASAQDDEGDQGPASEPPAELEDSPVDEALAEEVAASRLVVQTADSNLFTILSDGTDRLPLGDDATINTQPTWSPDSSFVAWSSTDPGSGVAELSASRFDDTGVHSAAASGPLTAIGWDPSSAVVSYLAGVPNGQQLSVVGIVEPTAETALDTGSPMWYSWSPNDQELLVNGDGFRIDRMDLEGSVIELSTNAGSFQAPVWVNAERALLFADADDGDPALVSTGVEGEGRLPMASYEGYLRMIANPDANRVAILVTERAPDIAEIVTASFAQGEAAVVVPQQRLYVVAVFGGSPTSLDGVPASAFMWDSTGDILAYLVQITEGDAPFFEWRFWTADGVSAGPLFQPTEDFKSQYMPYFDQLATDTTFFSPDSTQFVFTGQPLGASEDGVWVHEIGAGTAPTRLSEGTYAAWSQGAAGGGAQSIL